MSELSEKYEQFFRKCTKMFSKAINRIIEDKRTNQEQKLKYMKDIDKWIEVAERGSK